MSMTEETKKKISDALKQFYATGSKAVSDVKVGAAKIGAKIGNANLTSEERTTSLNGKVIGHSLKEYKVRDAVKDVGGAMQKSSLNQKAISIRDKIMHPISGKAVITVKSGKPTFIGMDAAGKANNAKRLAEAIAASKPKLSTSEMKTKAYVDRANAKAADPVAFKAKAVADNKAKTDAYVKSSMAKAAATKAATTKANAAPAVSMSSAAAKQKTDVAAYVKTKTAKAATTKANATAAPSIARASAASKQKAQVDAYVKAVKAKGASGSGVSQFKKANSIK